MHEKMPAHATTPASGSRPGFGEPPVPRELRLHSVLAAGWLALALQYGRFLMVGVAATAIHVLLYVAAVAMLGWPPLAAKALGFAAGVVLGAGLAVRRVPRTATVQGAIGLVTLALVATAWSLARP